MLKQICLIVFSLLLSSSLAQDTFATVQERGELNCGVTGLEAGTVVKLDDGGVLGFHAGFCQAIAAVVLGDSSAILYTPLQSSNAFAELDAENVDLLVGNNPLIASYDANLAIEFGATVFHKNRVPYALVVKSGDDHWLDVVSWTAYALMQAEEWQLRSDNLEDVLASTASLRIEAFLTKAGGLDQSLGLSPDALYQAITQVGNYAELYERHLGAASSEPIARGLNNLYLNNGLLYPPPFDAR